MKSIVKLLLRYLLPITCGSTTSILCFESRKVVRNVTMISIRKKRSTNASTIVIGQPQIQEIAAVLQKIWIGIVSELYMASIIMKLFQYFMNLPLFSKSNSFLIVSEAGFSDPLPPSLSLLASVLLSSSRSSSSSFLSVYSISFFSSLISSSCFSSP